MDIKTALIWATQKLEKNNIESSALDAEILLSQVLQQNKQFLYSQPQIKLNFWQWLKFKYLIWQRTHNTPIAYLTKQKEFYGLNFYINKHVLVPRPLTEGLVDKALEHIRKQKAENKRRINIADIGTGSGNIIITLIKELQKEKYNLDGFKFYATDISAAALKIAKKNAKIHQVNQCITFLQGDLLKPLAQKKIDLILANLPYLKPNDLNEPSISKESRLALIGDYSEFFKQISQLNPQPTVIYEDKTGVNIKMSSC